MKVGAFTPRSEKSGQGLAMSAPAVSVIMPVHNRAHLIGNSIDSVLSQSFAGFELIVVDDGSSDNLNRVLEAYDDPRLRLVRLPHNQGSNAARNAGIRASTAPILTFLDSDDLYLPEKLESVVAAFAANPEIEVRVDSFVKLTAPGSARPFVTMHNPETRDSEAFARALFRRELHKATSAISVSREAAERAGLFTADIRQRQDFDFLIRLAENARCSSSGEVQWIKNWTEERITDPARFVEATLALVDRHPQYLSNPAYRPGLARDVVRNSFALIRKGQGGKALANFALVTRRLGPLRAIQLFGGGLWQMLRRTLRPRPRFAPPAQPFSPEVEKVLKAARNRASGRT